MRRIAEPMVTTYRTLVDRIGRALTVARGPAASVTSQGQLEQARTGLAEATGTLEDATFDVEDTRLDLQDCGKRDRGDPRRSRARRTRRPTGRRDATLQAPDPAELARQAAEMATEQLAGFQ
jgi:hypothetical protein